MGTKAKRKLALKKETLRALDARELQMAAGGWDTTIFYSLWNSCTCPPPYDPKPAHVGTWNC